MAVYDEDVLMAQEMIEEFGQSVTWTTITNGTPPDPAKPHKPGPSVEVDNPATIAFFPPDGAMKTLFSMKDSEVAQGSVWGLLPAVTFAPKIKDTVTRGTEKLQVVDIKELNVNGESILFYVNFAT